MAQSHLASRVATPAVVAQRLADLLQCFPSAAIEGVQWQTLARKYEERHGAALDLEVLGHHSALAAATALLWDVVKVVESSDTDNPVVAIEDAIALTPSPGSLACWPSLYRTLCDIVQNHGTPEKKADEDDSATTHAILLSQVKPLLQRHWHSAFDDNGLIYFTGEGSTIKLKKMKHLLQALLRWREQYGSWRSSLKDGPRRKHSEVGAAVKMQLEFVPSKTKNDLLLRCVCVEKTIDAQVMSTYSSPVPKAKENGQLHLDLASRMEDTSTTESSSRPLSPSSQSSSRVSCTSANSQIQQEMERLRSENAHLRAYNLNLLEHHVRANENAALRTELFNTPPSLQLESLVSDVFDDPFEPPPEVRSHGSMWGVSPSNSSCFRSGSATPLSSVSEFSSSCMPSGYATPVPATSEHFAQPAPVGSLCTGVALVPMWFPMGDRLQIPRGIVQQVRATFERHASIPSFVTQQMQ